MCGVLGKWFRVIAFQGKSIKNSNKPQLPSLCQDRDSHIWLSNSDLIKGPIKCHLQAANIIFCVAALERNQKVFRI